MSNSIRDDSEVKKEIAKLTALGQVSFFFAVGLSTAILIASILVASISYYQLVSRPSRLLRITKNLKERMAKYILKEQSLNEFTAIIGTNAMTVHADRKTECKDVEDLIDTEIVAKSVDPFKAPSNRYEIGTEKDDDLRTCYGMDQDVFAKGAEVSPNEAKTKTKTGTNSDNVPQASTGAGEKRGKGTPQEGSQFA
uniref:Nematode cuticle collagen N-terminal domain-containing protein n=1 Tax=Panagrellus redivivus TaxID=6233 RepID=A0A7E4WBI8_PANRE